MNAPILECVPNFSEGRNPVKIEAIANAIRSIDGVKLLHIDTSPAANRTVMTFAGAPQAVTDAAFLAIQKAAEVIDMTAQDGVHPRIGATDVCPLVPLQGMTIQEADHYAQQLGKRVGDELGIPVYLYEYSAKSNHRRALPDIRKGQYEGFAEKIKQPEWAPDFGPLVFTPKSGATVIGARKVLVAFNISLKTDDISIAKKIAARIRTSGFWDVNEQGGKVKQEGWLSATRAIGWYMEDYKQAQVSFNLLDYTTTGPMEAYNACELLAMEYDTGVAGAEVIGLIPEICVLKAGFLTLMQKHITPQQDIALCIHEGISNLKLDKLKPFIPQEKILEYAMANAGIPIKTLS